MGSDPRLVKSNEPSLKKRFGQHFLRDTGVLERIVRWIEPSPADVFLEIGAGDGALSARLAPRVARLLSVEIDMDRIPQLEQSLQPFEQALVVPGDILHLDLAGLAELHVPAGGRLRVAGNLPYNIATAIIERLLHSDLPLGDMFFMVQLEVAQRLTARLGSRQYGFLSVDCQHHAEVQLGFKVSPACFVPRPQVYSAMVALLPINTGPAPGHREYFEALAKAAFSHRRKTLSNSLSMHPAFGPISGALLGRAGIDGSRRAEDLSVADYERLAAVYRDEFTG